MRSGLSVLVLIALALGAATLAGPAAGEQASQPSSPEAGYLDAGAFHSCAVQSFTLRCWGYGGAGELGYGGTRSVGDDETPASVGPVDFGGRNVTAVSAGDFHTCALLEDATVHCWGFGGNGRLGYGNEASILAAADAPAVFLGEGRTAKAISAGTGHTCAVLDNDRVLCWGFGIDGRLGQNATDDIGDNELPGERNPIDFGALDGAKAVSAGGFHTCALLLNDTVRCWGFGGAGRLGYGNQADVGRGCVIPPLGNVCEPTPDAPSPASVGPIDFGAGRTVKALSSGGFHNCVILDNDAVRCWGSGSSGHLGYGNDFNVGDNEFPGDRGPVDLGAGRTARAIAAGADHVCAVLDDASVRCWGSGGFGRLGYGNESFVGLQDTPGAVGPVNLGGRGAKAITAGFEHSCARLDDDSVRCWGSGRQGRLGYCNEVTIGDNETPGSAGPVALGQPGIPGQACRAAAPRRAPGYALPAADSLAAALAAQRARAAAFSSCLRRVKRKARSERRRARRLPSSRRRRALRAVKRRAARRRRACVRRHGRVPGRVTGLTARATGARTVQLTFKAVGTDGSKLPAANTYLVKQSRRPIRTARAFSRATSLCKGRCSFSNITRVGASLTLNVTRLRRGARYYFAVAGRDNVTRRKGPRSKAVRVRVR